MRLANAYVELFRNIPLLVQMFLWYFVLPEVVPRAFGATGSSSCRTPRSIPRSQRSASTRRRGSPSRCGPASRACRAASGYAGLALGLTLPQTYATCCCRWRYRIILPPLTSEFLNIIKNSAVALTIGLMELTARARAMQEFSFQVFEAFTAATVIYIVINIVVTFCDARGSSARVAVPGYIGSRRRSR